MNIVKVKVHKMYENFHRNPAIQYVGFFDDNNVLISLYDNNNIKLINKIGTLQWVSIATNQAYFVEIPDYISAEN